MSVDKTKPDRHASLLGDCMVSLLDESKRSVASVDSSEESERTRKKRRSSLALKRRSITGLPHVSPSVFQTDTLPSCSTKEDSLEKNVPIARLKPNPVNVCMDSTISQMTGQIDEMNKEYTRWQQILSEWQLKEEDSKKRLASKRVLPLEDIPADIVATGMSQYLTRPLCDLDDVQKKATTILEHCQFDRECCMLDFRLLRDTVTSIQRRSSRMSSQLADAMQENDGDARSAVRRLMDC